MQRTRKGDEESVWEAVVARSRSCRPPLLGKSFSSRLIGAHGELWWEQRSALTPYPNECGGEGEPWLTGCGAGQRFWLPSFVGERAALSMQQQPIRMWYQAAMGSVKVNMLPLPRPALSARIVPCIASTSAFEIVSPMPVPPSARVRDFSTR